MKPPHRRRGLRLALLGGVAAAALAVAVALNVTSALFQLELNTIDARYSIRGERPAPSDYVIVALDTRSVNDLDGPQAVTRAVHARVMKRIRRGRPRLIAYDFLFIGSKGRAQDAALRSGLRAARPVLLPTGPGLELVFGAREARRLGARLGDASIENDEDGVVRETPFYESGAPAFAVLGAELLGERPDPDEFADGAAPIDYRGGPGAFPEIRFSDVVLGRVAPDAFRDKVVLVGSTSPALTGAEDSFSTPLSSDPMPGVELHAHSLATVAAGVPLNDAPGAATVAVTILLALLAPLAALRLRAAPVIGVALIGGAAFLVVAQLAFGAGWILPVVSPLAALAIGGLGASAVDAALEGREQRRVRQAFARFVPESVVADVLARTDEDLRLGGETLEATVLFCDLRGFTRYGERNSARTVIETLNRYLTEMTEAIVAHGGTTVSYMGDGIMAVFGAPIEQGDHAQRAYDTAREMLERRLPAFNDWLRDEGLGDGFAMGIGICTGDVMSGNVGSARRLEYTAVGDTTNIAARLQELNKTVGSQLLMANSTRRKLDREAAEFVDVGEVGLSGRTGKVRVWGVASPPEIAPDPEPLAADAPRPG